MTDHRPRNFKDGQWEDAGDLADELQAATDKHNRDTIAGFAEIGFLPWTRIGDTESTETSTSTPIGLTIYRREKAPSFIMLIDGVDSDRGDMVYADSVIDMMDLIARWGPGVKAAADVTRGANIDLD